MSIRCDSQRIARKWGWQPPSIEATFIKVGISEAVDKVAGVVEILVLVAVKAKSVEHGSQTIIQINT